MIFSARVEKRPRRRQKCSDASIRPPTWAAWSNSTSIEVLAQVNQVRVVERRHAGRMRRQAATGVARIQVLRLGEMMEFRQPGEGVDAGQLGVPWIAAGRVHHDAGDAATGRG